MTRRSITLLAGATALLLGALAAVGCGSSGGSNKNSPAQPKTANGQSATVGVAGDTNGQGVNAFGGVWYVVSSSGDEVTTPTGSGGGFGY